MFRHSHPTRSNHQFMMFDTITSVVSRIPPQPAFTVSNLVILYSSCLQKTDVNMLHSGVSQMFFPDLTCPVFNSGLFSDSVDAETSLCVSFVIKIRNILLILQLAKWQLERQVFQAKHTVTASVSDPVDYSIYSSTIKAPSHCSVTTGHLHRASTLKNFGFGTFSLHLFYNAALFAFTVTVFKKTGAGQTSSLLYTLFSIILFHIFRCTVCVLFPIFCHFVVIVLIIM